MKTKNKLLQIQERRKFIWISLFAVAMGMLESAVVIYLRELYYSEGFGFPLSRTSQTVAVTELLRELATLIMLSATAAVAGKNTTERFAWFLYSFAVWDIFYYIFLYLLIGWPASIFDWDVLFLLPVMWVGPVWAPVLLAVLMIILALIIIRFSQRGKQVIISIKHWLLLLAGAIIVIISFCTDFFQYMLRTFPEQDFSKLFFSKQTFDFAADYTPQAFNHPLYILGFTVIVSAVVYLYLSNKRKVI